jgi:NAD(P)-dependent dehydrogenase (short-subunit alcohol dehydrogenase family)
MKIEFGDKVALVTGGGSGIGRAICLAFADAGARVACVDIDSAQGEQTAALIRQRGGEALFARADVTDSESVRSYVETTTAAYGRIDAFANNAGYEGEVKSTTDYPLDVFDRVMAVNVRGVFLGLKYVLPVMQIQRSGAVINTGSTGSHVGAPGVCAYTASKHAVLGLTRTAALEAANFGVRVNAVCPGGTKTRMLHSLSEGRSQSEDLAFNLTTPNGRVAEPDEIAAMVLFLASDYARHMIGQYVIVDGGRLAM